MTPEQEVARKKRAVAAARALLSMELGLAHGTKRVRSALYHLGCDVSNEFPAFGKFLDAIPKEVPLGELRLLCQEKLLFSSDAILSSVEGKHRTAILLECLAVIRTYGSARNSDEH